MNYLSNYPMRLAKVTMALMRLVGLFALALFFGIMFPDIAQTVDNAYVKAVAGNRFLADLAFTSLGVSALFWYLVLVWKAAHAAFRELFDVFTSNPWKQRKGKG